MKNRFEESITRTNKLWCSGCNEKIQKGDTVIFELDYDKKKPMQNVYCRMCGKEWEQEIIEDTRHPFDIEN